MKNASVTQRVHFWTGVLPLIGSGGFVLVVGVLHLLQPDYKGSSQLMSELALGPYGWAMLPAFGFLSLATGGCWWGVKASGARRGVQAILVLAALAFLGAGVFPLGVWSGEHIALIASAFIAMGLAMYLLPSEDLTFGFPRWPSWLMGLGMAVSVALGESFIPMGVGQRLAAAFLIAWFAWVGILLLAVPHDPFQPTGPKRAGG